VAVFERAYARLRFADGELQTEDVVGLAEEYEAGAVFGRLQSVDDHVELAALERRDDGLPVGRDEFGSAVHRRRERVNHLLLVADVLLRVRRVGEDVGRAAAGVCAPAQDRLRVYGKWGEKQEE